MHLTALGLGQTVQPGLLCHLPSSHSALVYYSFLPHISPAPAILGQLARYIQHQEAVAAES